jgi:hypothetical protein
VGQVVEIQTDVHGAGNFIRAKVKLDVRKVLERFVSMIREGKREVLLLKYEKMPRFCGSCGFIGHSYLECGSGEHREEDLKWGEWLKEDWDTWHGRGGLAGRGGGRGHRGGRFDGNRGRGREYSEEQDRNTGGRGNSVNPSWRHNALPLMNSGAIIDPSLKDTATSPFKVKDMDVDSEGNSIVGTKRNLAEQFENHNDI